MAKKGAYPIILKRTADGYYVEIPDFDSGTQGRDIPETMEMARDAIGLLGIDLEDEEKELPEPAPRHISADEEPRQNVADNQPGDAENDKYDKQKDHIRNHSVERLCYRHGVMFKLGRDKFQALLSHAVYPLPA